MVGGVTPLLDGIRTDSEFVFLVGDWVCGGLGSRGGWYEFGVRQSIHHLCVCVLVCVCVFVRQMSVRVCVSEIEKINRCRGSPSGNWFRFCCVFDTMCIVFLIDLVDRLS